MRGLKGCEITVLGTKDANFKMSSLTAARDWLTFGRPANRMRPSGLISGGQPTKVSVSPCWTLSVTSRPVLSLW